MARGTLTIHSVSRALAPHLEWAVSGVLGVPVRVKWHRHESDPSQLRMAINWTGPEGLGARLATALRGWDSVRFEVTQEPGGGEEGARWMYTPSLGIHHAAIDAAGNVTLTEDRIRFCIAAGAGDAARIEQESGKALGEAWERELEVFRVAASGEEPRRLHLVG